MRGEPAVGRQSEHHVIAKRKTEVWHADAVEKNVLKLVIIVGLSVFRLSEYFNFSDVNIILFCFRIWHE